MSVRRVTYYQVSCDYPDHGVPNELAKGTGYRLIDNLVICNSCWDDKLIVENLLKLLNTQTIYTEVGMEQ